MKTRVKKTKIRFRIWFSHFRQKVSFWQERVIEAWQSETADWVKLLAGCLLIAFFLSGISKISESLDQLPANLYVEFLGLIFDIALVGIIFSLGTRRRERRQDIKRYQEEIDDLKKWDCEEARFRIAGNIRRLNRLGVTAIDLCGAEISNFSFSRSDILSISGSVFYNGEWGTGSSRERSKLCRVSFDYVDCTGVMFSPYYPLPTFIGAEPFIKLQDCSFLKTVLKRVKFDGAYLLWSESPPGDIFETDVTDDGEEIRYQTYYPPFFEADLEGASFKQVYFKNADFRQADNLKMADFSGARGLDSCVFDHDDAAYLRERGLLR